MSGIKKKVAEVFFSIIAKKQIWYTNQILTPGTKVLQNQSKPKKYSWEAYSQD